MKTTSIEKVLEEKKEDKKIIKFELSDGKKVEMDLTHLDGNLLMKARYAQGLSSKISLSIFLLAEVTKFDGEKMIPQDILNLNLEDVVTLEDVFTSRKSPNE